MSSERQLLTPYWGLITKMERCPAYPDQGGLKLEMLAFGAERAEKTWRKGHPDFCSDGLTGIKEAITAAYPSTEYQSCPVRKVRNKLKYVAYKVRKASLCQGSENDLQYCYSSRKAGR